MPRIEAFQRRMGWRFHWVSAFANDFQRDYGVHFTKEELAGEVNYNYQKTRFGLEEAPGLSVFYKDESGEIFHTYSTYARGLDPLVGTYQFLDLVPKGRDEDGLAFSMAWVRHHDKYGDDYVVDPTATYEQPRDIGRVLQRTRKVRDDWAVLHGRAGVAPPRPAALHGRGFDPARRPCWYCCRNARCASPPG